MAIVDYSRYITNESMNINYFKESEKYKPANVKTLLISEAPPPSGKSYFYVPRPMSNNRPIRYDKSLPATIFYHYFQTRPETEEEYVQLLLKLQEMGIFLIDICDEPIRIRDKNGINKNNLNYLIAKIPSLRSKIRERGINIEDSDIIFLLPRQNYIQHLKKEFPNAKYTRWIDFRMGNDITNHSSGRRKCSS